MPEPISALCRDPVHTRARAEAGEPTPCFRCLAWSGTECFFITTGQRPKRTKRHKPSPTPDKLWDLPEQET